MRDDWLVTNCTVVTSRIQMNLGAYRNVYEISFLKGNTSVSGVGAFYQYVDTWTTQSVAEKRMEEYPNGSVSASCGVPPGALMYADVDVSTYKSVAVLDLPQSTIDYLLAGFRVCEALGFLSLTLALLSLAASVFMFFKEKDLNLPCNRPARFRLVQDKRETLLDWRGRSVNSGVDESTPLTKETKRVYSSL